MFNDYFDDLGRPAVEVRRHLAKLAAERALALDTGLAEVATYMNELEEEIAACREYYTLSAVTEIVTLRAEMSGAQQGCVVGSRRAPAGPRGSASPGTIITTSNWRSSLFSREPMRRIALAVPRNRPDTHMG